MSLNQQLLLFQNDPLLYEGIPETIKQITKIYIKQVYWVIDIVICKKKIYLKEF